MFSQALPVEDKRFQGVGRKWQNNFDYYQRKTFNDQYKNEGLWGPAADVAETAFNALGATVETTLNPYEHPGRYPKTRNGRVSKVSSAEINTPSMSKNNKITKSGLTVAEAAENNRKRQLRLARGRRNAKLRGAPPPPPRRRRRRPPPTGPGKRGVGRLPMDAPVNMSQNKRSGVELLFSAGRKPGCMRIRVKFGIAQIGVFTVGGAGPFLAWHTLGAAPGTGTQILPLNPSDDYYFPGYIFQLARLFSKFYLNKASLEVCPRVSTINVAAWTLAFSKDVMWPESRNLLIGTQAHPDELSLKSLVNACTEVAYRDCGVIADDIDTKKEYYMDYNQGFGFPLPIVYDGTHSAEFRQAVPGIFMIAGQPNGTDPVGTVYSDVYMTMDIEMCEFSTQQLSNVGLSRVKEKEDEKHNSDFDDHFSVVSTKSSSRKSRVG